MKDHKMRQIINDVYLLFIRIMNMASFFKKKYFDLFLLRIWDSTPSSRPSIKALIMSSLIFLVSQGGGGGGETYVYELLMALYIFKKN